MLNLHFRRQHPISHFIVDFYCHQIRLVIVVDGSIHDEEEHAFADRKRQIHLENLGLTVIRFKNEEVQYFPEQVMQALKDKCIELLELQ